ncbi:hypothetical protein AUEXF2481DRAFT_336827 [Aureobasidium subglaciale EXF-2481]|uniref:Uncharacterized protein n=1 Tax=Aureobasidium subglaciale (strain EXF-2481) TaxID=1043005 RepID=A0A074Z2L7_AURSE|nr:uncharacterized protein AUEXF2481DRAFT_336827 [Aureobasidium subglaciale EXF-2481]KEQ93311.1 hypothetical protein AUEXF2481DRAFT_336827 [Aureobasidium subglaciale EXF-2481]
MMSIAKQVSESRIEYQAACNCSTDARTRSRPQRSDRHCHTCSRRDAIEKTWWMFCWKAVFESDYVARRWCKQLEVCCSVVLPIDPPHKLMNRMSGSTCSDQSWSDAHVRPGAMASEPRRVMVAEHDMVQAETRKLLRKCEDTGTTEGCMWDATNETTDLMVCEIT